MSTQDDGRIRCPRCGAEYKLQTPGGVCPACAFGATLSAPSAEGGASKLSLEDIPVPAGQGTIGKEGAGDPAKTIFVSGIVEEQPGSRIGHYKLLQRIGEGGCGVVYMAEQEEPIRRRVAFKVIKRGMDTKEVIARFEAERQALALMDHPIIAKVLDAGATETGRPYFVMELVKGIRITDFCDRNKLATKERLDLFIQVCHAIQHAHQKGIIHRDIKPSNVLVTLQDGVPVPKVIDFGIAKATQQPLTYKTVVTAFGQFIGTPAYMSPEQAELSGLDIDTRSDIYALGVLLYELLTGKTPFDAKRLVEAGLNEIRRIISEEEPPRPSTRLSTLTAEEQTTTAKLRHTDPPKLVHLVSGDLDWIVMKCLEKDRSRRYETANALAADVARHLENEPVLAGPPTTAYRVGKLLRKHRAAVSVAAAFVLLLTLTTSLSVSLAYWANRERASAMKAKAEAQQKAAAEAKAKEEMQVHRKRAEAALDEMQMQRAEDLFVAGDSARAIAYLADVLSRDRSNRVAAERVLSALTFRSFAVPLSRPLLHDFWVRAAQFSPDGKRVVTASQDGTARVWDAQTGEPLTRPLRHKGFVSAAQFSPDGRRVVTASQDKTARVWDAQTGKPVTEPLRHEGEVHAAQFSPDGLRVLTASCDKTARVWEVQTGKPLTEPLRHGACVPAAQFSPDGRRVVTASGDKTARVWDAQSGKPLTEPLRHGSGIRSVQFSPDGLWVVTASWDKSARVWDALTGKPLAEALQHQGEVCSAQFSPDGRRVVTASEDKTARVWDAQTGRPLTEPLRLDDVVQSAQFSPDGLRVLTASMTARVWDAQSGKPLTETFHGQGQIQSAQFSPDGLRVLTASSDMTARVWDAQTGKPLSEPVRHGRGIFFAAFSPDGKRVVTASHDYTARVWDAQSGKPLTDPFGYEDGVLSAQFSPDGLRVITGSSGKSARVWDALTGKLLTEPLRHQSRVQFAQFSPDGLRAVTASDDQTARVWDAQTGKPLTEPLRHERDVLFAEFSPEGRRVVTASWDQTARVWDAQTGKPLTEPLRHHGVVISAQFSPDGRRVLTASWDSTARVWDAQTGKPLTEPLRHERNLRCARFSPDGGRVVTASMDKTARVWDAQTGKPLTGPLRHEDEVCSAQFSPDGLRVVTASHDRTARVWDAQTGMPLGEPIRHEDIVMSAQFSPDGRRVVTASEDKTARVWELPFGSGPAPAWLPQLAVMVAGKRLSGTTVLEPVAPEGFLRLKDQLMRSAETNCYTQWAKWFCSDRSARPIAPGSSISVPEYVQRRISEDTLDSLREAVILSPTNAVVLARFARRIMQMAPSLNPDQKTEAAFHLGRAIELAPTNPEVLQMVNEIGAQARRAKAESAPKARVLDDQRDRASSGQAESLNALAWLFATSPREDLRDGRIAVALAERAAAATSRKDPAILGTLAAGLAEAGRFAEAAGVQREALGLLSDATSKEDYSSRLKLYESNAPYRDAAANELTPATDDRLGMAALLRARGTLHAQFAPWTLATGDLAKAIELNPDENYNWYQLAPLLLETGDTGGYRKHCHAMLARFGTTDAPPTAERTAKACLLLPLEGADLAAAAKLAETAVTLGKDDAWVAYYQFAKGLAEYRQANFAQAVEWTQKALAQSGTDYNRDVQAYSVLALALHRLNQAGEAREALSNATELAGAKLPKLDSGDLGPNWHDWIIAQTLLREAKALMEGPAKGNDKTQ